MTAPDPANVLIGGMEKRAISIVPYDESWPSQFRLHRGRIMHALGETLCAADHIGSTAVPGLAAKAIIDIVVTVPDAGDEIAYLLAMECAGYVLRVREPAFHQHRMFRTPERTVHIHVYSEGCIERERNIAFRDYLRANPARCRAYEALKRQLSQTDWADLNAYAAAKTAFIEETLRLAQ